MKTKWEIRTVDLWKREVQSFGKYNDSLVPMEARCYGSFAIREVDGYKSKSYVVHQLPTGLVICQDLKRADARRLAEYLDRDWRAVFAAATDAEVCRATPRWLILWLRQIQRDGWTEPPDKQGELFGVGE